MIEGVNQTKADTFGDCVIKSLSLKSFDVTFTHHLNVETTENAGHKVFMGTKIPHLILAHDLLVIEI